MQEKMHHVLKQYVVKGNEYIAKCTLLCFHSFSVSRVRFNYRGLSVMKKTSAPFLKLCREFSAFYRQFSAVPEFFRPN